MPARHILQDARKGSHSSFFNESFFNIDAITSEFPTISNTHIVICHTGTTFIIIYLINLSYLMYGRARFSLFHVSNGFPIMSNTHLVTMENIKASITISLI